MFLSMTKTLLNFLGYHIKIAIQIKRKARVFRNKTESSKNQIFDRTGELLDVERKKPKK
jgi:hypothetical protein